MAVTLEINFIRKQADSWLITVEALLKNESKVRYAFTYFTLKITFSVAGDKLENRKVTVENEKDIYLSARFPHPIVDTSWLDDAEDRDDRLDYGALAWNPVKAIVGFLQLAYLSPQRWSVLIANCFMIAKKIGSRSASLP